MIPAIRSIKTVVLVAAALLLVEAVPVHAYVDPGSGSMLLQLVTGGVAGLLILVRLYWQRLKNLIRGRAADEPVATSRAEAAKDRS